MFSGIIEGLGVVESIELNGTNRTFVISSNLSQHLQVDQSVAHNGVCLTVEKVSGNTHQVTAIEETLLKTNLSFLKVNDKVNLERSLTLQKLIDGHLVQGHVDTTATCISIVDKNGSRLCRFQYPENYMHLIIEKGSVCINGISLTCFDLAKNEFSVAIIPYTWEHTNIGSLKISDKVNIEFDLIGKYVQRGRELNSSPE